MRETPFSSYKSRFAGKTAIIVGKGPTRFDYQDLARHRAPVVFINDAVAFETHVAPGEPSFFFAHDQIMTVWLTRGIRSAAVIPEDGKVVSGKSDPVLEVPMDVVFYRWMENHPGADVLAWSRAELARERVLYTESGTIHSALHFVWYCGFARVRFIGCDGISRAASDASLSDAASGYDKRIRNASKSTWGDLGRIRRTQDRLCRRFAFDVQYWGTPVDQPGLAKADLAMRNLWHSVKRRVRGAT